MFNIILPKIFKAKNKLNILKEPNKNKNKFITNNYTFKYKHFSPYIVEWINGIYYYNKNVIKVLPNLNIRVHNLIKSYFNLFIIKYNKLKTKEWHVRTKRSSSKKLIISKSNIKHTNDKAVITVYTYNNNIYYESIINQLITTDQIKKNFLYSALFRHLKKKYILLERELKDKLKNKYYKRYLREIIINKHKLYFKNIEYYESLNFGNLNTIMYKKNNLLFLNYIKREIKVVFGQKINYYIKKLMLDEIISIGYRQYIYIEQYKYEKQYIKLLTVLLENIYNKKVILDIVNLKYFYNSNSIISDSLLTKLKIKKNKIVNTFDLLLKEFNVPAVNIKNVYNDMYNRKQFKQKIFLKDLIMNSNIISHELNNLNSKDIIETSLSKFSNKHSIIYHNEKIEGSQLDKFNVNLDKIVNSLKNKFTKGIRIEVAGRLTKNNTANRSIYKFRYKGNVRNEDSSTKKLSTVLLRGHAKSNLIYIKSRSKVRVGAFGLKTWVSSY